MMISQGEGARWVLHLENMRQQNITAFNRAVENVFAQGPRILILDCKELQSLDY